jgi:hypothetical protein
MLNAETRALFPTRPAQLAPTGATLLGGDVFRGTVPIRSHCRPNSDTDICEIKGRGGPFLAPPVSQPRLAQDWRGFFVKGTFTPAASFFANAVMARLIALVIVATALAACAGHVADYIPTWAGGPPKDLPPRPGTPEYDAYRQKMDDEVTRDKSKDPPKPKTDPGIAGLPK